VRFDRVQKTHWWREYTELATLFFLHAMAMGMWFVPLGSVLDAHGLSALKPAAFATSGISAFISPLIFGALADQRFSPVKILRGLAIGTAISMTLAATAIGQKWSPFAILALMQVHSLFSAPTFGISTTIILARLSDAKREYGPLRAMATFGWMVGCWIVSALSFDGSSGAGYGGAIVWVVVAAFTFVLPAVDPPPSTGVLGWKQRLGLDAIGLLKSKDTRTVFIGAAVYNAPLCAFYPYTPTNMADLGLTHTTAWMTLGQVTEIASMFCLAGLLTHWRLKWIFLVGMGFGVARFAACAIGGKAWLLTGVALHGFAFTLYFITAQIYLEQRIPAAWRARAQALLTLMLSGVGNTIGYFSCGALKRANTTGSQTDWTSFWAVLSGVVAVIWLWFAWSYHGRPGANPASPAEPTVPPGIPPEPERSA
jgi:MFS family permease